MTESYRKLHVIHELGAIIVLDRVLLGASRELPGGREPLPIPQHGARVRDTRPPNAHGCEDLAAWHADIASTAVVKVDGESGGNGVGAPAR